MLSSIAKENHPDVTDCPTASNTFKAAASAHEVLANRDKRAQYDQTLPKPQKANPNQPRGSTETPIETEMRTLIESNQVDEAVKKWAAFGSSVPLLIHMFEMCARYKRMPGDLKGLLGNLHSSDPENQSWTPAGVVGQ